jgi:hypothetical protein
MTIVDWLNSPEGAALVRALTLLLVAIAGYLSFLARQQSVDNSKKLDGHLEEHIVEATKKDPPK